jgi:hypothetical protein
MATMSIEAAEGQLIEYQESLWTSWDDSPPDHLYHYTSLNGMRGIVGDRVFWASDIRYMNDTTEHGYAWTVVQKALADKRDILSTGLTDNFERHCGIPGLGTEWFQYAVCFCGAKDLLSQWRGYTPQGKGIALGILFAALRQYAGKEFALIRVLYDPNRQTKIVTSFVDRALNLWEETKPETEAEAK